MATEQPIENPQPEAQLQEDQPRAHSVFHLKKEKPVRKPRPVVYQIYLCCRCADENSKNGKIGGAWAADIFRPPQDTTSQHKRGSYSLSAVEEADDHIQIGLAALREIFKWITADVEESAWSYISVSIMCSDIFIVNLLQEWLPAWHKQEYKISKTAEHLRPNVEILREIGNITSRIKLSASWNVDTAKEMIAVRNNVNKLLNE
jgi:hypothetical protein